MTDRIEIRDLRVTGVHGVLPEEQARAQPFAVDVVCYVPMIEKLRNLAESFSPFRFRDNRMLGGDAKKIRRPYRVAGKGNANL